MIEKVIPEVTYRNEKKTSREVLNCIDKIKRRFSWHIEISNVIKSLLDFYDPVCSSMKKIYEGSLRLEKDDCNKIMSQELFKC